MKRIIYLFISFLVMIACEAPIEEAPVDQDSFSKVRETQLEISKDVNNRAPQVVDGYVDDDLVYDLIAANLVLEELFGLISQLGIELPPEIMDKLIQHSLIVGNLDANVVCEETKPDAALVDQYRCSDNRVALCHIPKARPEKASVIRVEEAAYDEILKLEKQATTVFLVDCMPVEDILENKVGQVNCAMACLDEAKILALKEEERLLREEITEDFLQMGIDLNQQIDITQIKKEIEEKNKDLEQVEKELEQLLQR
jgi:hypothetical protein